MRGAGERTEVLRTYGHRPQLVQYIAVMIGGLLAGIGGAQLSTAYANAWFENMVQGRGFIAVAVVIFAARQPVQGDGRVRTCSVPRSRCRRRCRHAA